MRQDPKMDWTQTAWAMSVTQPEMASNALRTWIPMIPGARIFIVASRGVAPRDKRRGVEYHTFTGPLNPDKYMHMWTLLYAANCPILVKLDTDTVVSPPKVAMFWHNISRDSAIYAGSTMRTYRLKSRHFEHVNRNAITPYAYIQGGFEMFTRTAFARARPCWTRIRPEHVRDHLTSHCEDALLGICMGASGIASLNLEHVSPWKVALPACRSFMAFHLVKHNYLRVFEDCVGGYSHFSWARSSLSDSSTSDSAFLVPM